MEEFEDFTAKVPTQTPTALHRVGDRLLVNLRGEAPKLEDEALTLHEQIHEYQGCASTGAVARAATKAEKKWANKAGTPLHYKPPPKQNKARKKTRNKRRRGTN